MSKLFLIISIVLLIFTLFIIPAHARSGCCSHHKGVCGCKCCDGSPLSAKCAPYYPSCNFGYNSINTVIPEPPKVETNSDEDGDAFAGFLVFTTIGSGVYFYKKRKIS